VDADPVLIRATPYTRQLSDALRQAIERGTYDAGSTLPPERLIAERYNVSLGTVRQALAMLVAEGFVIKVNGKGSVVRGRPGPPTTVTRNPLDPWADLIPAGDPEHRREPAKPRTAELLGIRVGAPLYVIDQGATHKATGRSVLTRRALPNRAYDGIADYPDPFGPREPIMSALAQQHGPLSIAEYVRPLMPDTDERHALSLGPGDLILEATRVTRAADGLGLLAECERYGEGIQLTYPLV
jgi:GntR family transcriptional regulator